MPLSETHCATPTALLDQAREKNAATIAKLVPIIDASIAAGRVLHTFGSGHSEMIAREIIGRAVVRDITLDGNTLKDSPDIDKKPCVADGHAGVGISTPYLQFRYAQACRTKEFEGQGDTQVFGSISATILF